MLLDERKRQIDTIGDELERAYEEGGDEGVDAYLAELDRSLAGFQHGHRQLADFIAEKFPIRAASP